MHATPEPDRITRKKLATFTHSFILSFLLLVCFFTHIITLNKNISYIIIIIRVCIYVSMFFTISTTSTNSSPSNPWNRRIYFTKFSSFGLMQILTLVNFVDPTLPSHDNGNGYVLPARGRAFPLQSRAESEIFHGDGSCIKCFFYWRTMYHFKQTYTNAWETTIAVLSKIFISEYIFGEQCLQTNKSLV